MTGKIIKGIAGFYYVHNGADRIYACKAKGIFRNQKIKPLVGDNVEFAVLDEAAAEGNIEAILPRKNELVRPAAANVDQGLIIFALTQPEPNLNLLDRFLVMMEWVNIPCMICFNKTDLDEDQHLGDYYKRIYQKAGYPVCTVSVKSQAGIDCIRDFIRGKTTVLAGPSGVGKSSITNLIQPKALMETGEISQKVKRGKHTTRHCELFFAEQHTYLMDTPGFSSMYVQQMEEGALKDCFPEFSAYQEDCRFLGCVHIGEPVCGIKKAVEEDLISRSRYENYAAIYQEIKGKRRY